MNTRKTPALPLSLPLLLATLLPAQETDEQRLVAALGDFAADLHGQLAERADGPLFAPASVSIAMLMLLPGARGRTADEIATMLHLPADLRGERLDATARQLVSRTAMLGNGGLGEGPLLSITNDFWGQTGHEFVPEYTRLLKRSFGGSVHEVDFAADPEAARRRINGHLAKATHDRIEELIPRGLVTPETRAVISNAIWYRGGWAHGFYRPQRLAEFHVTADKTVDAPLMWVTANFRYAENDRWQAVELLMNDEVVAFELVLPRPGQSLASAERALLRGDHLRGRGETSVRLAMPAFDVHGRHRLREPLEALGMQSAFDPTRADFTGIDEKRPLVIDDVMHGTWIRVDENGVEAAAATATIAKGGGARIEEPIEMRADRPFAFGLRDRRTGLLLFVGRVIDPTTGA